MMVNLGAAVNVIHGIRTHPAQTTGCPTWDEAGIRAALTACEGSPGPSSQPPHSPPRTRTCAPRPCQRSGTTGP